jgi:hypothetical protein
MERGKPLSASPARTYHAPTFAAQEQNYWGRDQQGHSEWPADLPSSGDSKVALVSNSVYD